MPFFLLVSWLKDLLISFIVSKNQYLESLFLWIVCFYFIDFCFNSYHFLFLDLVCSYFSKFLCCIIKSFTYAFLIFFKHKHLELDISILESLLMCPKNFVVLLFYFNLVPGISLYFSLFLFDSLAFQEQVV